MGRTRLVCAILGSVMSRLQETYNDLQEAKREKRELSKAFTDELKHNAEYNRIVEEAKLLREKKKTIENDVKSRALKDAQRLDDLKLEIASLQELLSDLSLNMYLAKENVEVTDTTDQRWVPYFSVRFKKDG